MIKATSRFPAGPGWVSGSMRASLTNTESAGRLSSLRKDVVMASAFSKSSFYRTSILLWLFVSFAGQMLDAPRIVFATAATSPAQATTPEGGGEASQAIPGTRPNPATLPSPLSAKQQRDLLKANFEKMKRDAGELAGLAKALQDELNKSNENILSLDVVEKAEKIEKLARKIKGTARGY
jgi:hypothetical protein